MLELAGITINYEGRTILDNACLSVARGEIVSLVGPSGSGKTTLLRVIAGLELPSRGTVVIDNELMTGIPTHKRDVGLVFQDNSYFHTFAFLTTSLTHCELNEFQKHCRLRK